MKPAIVALLREATGMGKRRVREWMEWGDKNPGAFANQLLGFAHLAEHRHTVLSARRRAFRKAHRLVRLRSLSEELREYSGEILSR